MRRSSGNLFVSALVLGMAISLAAPADALGQRRARRTRPSGPAPAAEQEQRQGTDAQLDLEARQLFLAGQAAYDAGRYDAALEYFTRAHSLSGRPGLLFNVASAAERLRRDEEALRAYQDYLVALPDAPNREFTEQRIAFLREQIASEARLREAAQRAEEAERAEEAQRARALDEAEPRAATAPSGAPRESERSAGEEPELVGGPSLGAAVAPGALAATVDDDRGEGGDLTEQWWFWTLVGVAVVGVGVGIGAGVAAASGGGDDVAPAVEGDFGPGGIVVALEAF